jgi:hypothetical protein
VILLPIPAQLSATLSAYASLWQADATDADIDAAFARASLITVLAPTAQVSPSSASTARWPSAR